MVSVNLGNNAYSGGAFYNITSPPGVGGGINRPAPAQGGPLSGVTSSEPLMMKNNSTSNIRIPYARVVPLPDANFGLPMTDDDASAVVDPAELAQRMAEGSLKIVRETDALVATKLAFILGSRSGTFSTHQSMNAFFGMYEQNGSAVTGMGPYTAGVDRITKLGSLEFVTRHFEYFLGDKYIDLSVRLSADPKNEGCTLSKIYYDGGGVAGQTLCTIGDIAHRIADNDDERTGKRSASVPPDATKGGLLIGDRSPFLRGYLLASKMVVSSQEYRPGHSVPERIPRNLGDDVAFEILNQKLMEQGIMDWVPDGIVISKLDNGESVDQQAMFDARDGQLFNIAIKGPVNATNWTGNYKLAVLPTDKVFVLVIADVVFNMNKAEVEAMGGGEFAPKLANHKLSSTDMTAYNEKRKQLLDSGGLPPDALTPVTIADRSKAGVLMNFRLRLSTSSEMVRFSGGKGMSGNSFENERLGLKLSKDMGEYVVGGWCIGTVLDSAAARASLPGMRGIYGSESSGLHNSAINLNVGVKWVTGDDLFRRYCNIEGKVRNRYDDGQRMWITRDNHSIERTAP